MIAANASDQPKRLRRVAIVEDACLVCGRQDTRQLIQTSPIARLDPILRNGVPASLNALADAQDVYQRIVQGDKDQAGGVASGAPR